MTERKKPLSPFGKRIKLFLLETDRKQEWLIAEVKRKCPKIYVDSSNLYKIMIGDIQGGRVVEAIKEIMQEATGE